MQPLNKSFIYGICFASVTWILSFYLYINLTKDDQLTSTPLTRTKAPFKAEQQAWGQVFYSRSSNKHSAKYVNSVDLIKKLQPVMITQETLVEDFGLVKTAEDQRVRDEGYKKHAFNVLISNQLAYNRSIPDTRNELCKSINYSENLPRASIIICFYNEHYQTLLRTIHSIINRTPIKYLEEIILVDDYSDIENLHTDLQNYFGKHFSNFVKLIRTDRREGLIRARVLGARHSKGDVLVFLDSHVEVNKGWIEPLLARIKENSTNVVTPVIDIINADTFSYTSSPLVRGGFNWGLHFKWDNLPKGTLSKGEDFVKPILSPTMAGGLFAINRTYFTELGEYDMGMNIWGGENLEISFRIWMCGGRLELLPCSRVGHVFRQRRPYGAPNGEDTMLHNSLRVAQVWMDDYKQYFLSQRPDAKKIDYGDVSSRLELRKYLKCQDFDWYLKNIYPELTLPSDNEERLKKKWAALERDKYQPWHSRKRNYVDQFQIRLSNSSLCVQSASDVKTKGAQLILKKCLRTKSQIWYETDKSELVLAQLLCLQSGKRAPVLYKCHEIGGDQEWKHVKSKNTAIYNMAVGTCLAASKKEVNAPIVMKICSNDESLTNWDIV